MKEAACAACLWLLRNKTEISTRKRFIKAGAEPDGIMHGSGEFLVTDRYGETVPEPFGVVRRNDFIRSRSQDADRAGDFGRGQV